MPLSSLVRAAAFAACLTPLISATVPGHPQLPEPVAKPLSRGWGSAVSHYLGAMNDLNIQPLLAYELLDHGEEMEAYSVQALADRICSETKIVHDFGRRECQQRLLTRWKKRSEKTEPAQD